MKTIIGRIICKFQGHRRGKRVTGTDQVKCPRCAATWTRKVKGA